MDALSKPFFSKIGVENSSEVSGNNNHRFLIRIELGVLLGFCFRRAYLPRCYSCHNSKVITLGYLRWLVICLTVQQLLINFVPFAFIYLFIPLEHTGNHLWISSPRGMHGRLSFS